jgi:hypothetical protein
MTQKTFTEHATEFANEMAEVQTRYDTRVLAPMCLMTAATAYRALLAAGLVTPAGLVSAFAAAMASAQEPQKMPTINTGEGQGRVQ